MITISEITTHAKFILKYLHKNAWTIIFILAGCYFCYDQFIDPLLHKYQTSQSYKAATNPDRVAVLSPDMKRIRIRQQEQAMQRSIEAAEEKKRKLAEERVRKRVKSPEEERWEKRGGEGTRLGDADVVAGGTGGDGTGDNDDGLRRRRR
ncbi:hypothetical protein ACHAXR_006324 [Thalassiosira sp. AJA248-18]